MNRLAFLMLALLCNSCYSQEKLEVCIYYKELEVKNSQMPLYRCKVKGISFLSFNGQINNTKSSMEDFLYILNDEGRNIGFVSTSSVKTLKPLDILLHEKYVQKINIDEEKMLSGHLDDIEVDYKFLNKVASENLYIFEAKEIQNTFLILEISSDGVLTKSTSL